MATSTDMKGNVVKMEVDYSDTVDKRIPECEALAAVSDSCFYYSVNVPGRTLFTLHVLCSDRIIFLACRLAGSFFHNSFCPHCLTGWKT